MLLNKTEFHHQSIEKVKRLWHLYILDENPAQFEAEFSTLANNLLMIGTGRHEMYRSRNEFLEGMSQDQIEAHDIQFELQDEWYEVQDISDTVCIVYGSIWAREKVSPGQTVFVDMEGSRFTVVCLNTEQGVEVCSVHHSMPYADQGADEYYPKTLSLLAKELERKVELDSMTGFYSRFYMEKYVTKIMKDNDGYFFVIDLDEFKHINDTKGHLIGDQVIIEFANTLKKIASPTTLLGRMGGDEFAIWDFDIRSKSEAESKFNELSLACKKITDRLGVLVSCSAGVVFCSHTDENFSSIYAKADKALYHAKSTGKRQLHWFNEGN